MKELAFRIEVLTCNPTFWVPGDLSYILITFGISRTTNNNILSTLIFSHFSYLISMGSAVQEYTFSCYSLLTLARSLATEELSNPLPPR